MGPPADGGDGRSVSTARGSLTVSVWTLVSRLTGLLRVVAIGAVLGPTFFANAFLAANSVPNLTYAAVAGPVMGLVLIPAVVRSLRRDGERGAADMVAGVSGYLVKVAGAAALAIALASPGLAWAVTAGIPDAEVRGHAWTLALLVILFVAPQVVCYTVAGIGEAVQQARGRFVLSAAAPVLENLGLIATMGLFALVFPAGADVLDTSVPMVLMLGAGSTVSVALHAWAQMAGARRAGLPIRLRRSPAAEPTTREVTRRLRSSVVVAGFPALSMFALLALAATVPGGTYVFQTAMSMYFVVAALGVGAVGVAALPGVSRAVERRDEAAFGAAWREAVSLTATASLPAALLLLAFAGPVAALLVHGEVSNPQILSWLTACLVVLAVAQVANAVHEIGRQALFARLDVRRARRLSTVVLVVRLALGSGALLLPVGVHRLLGLCAAVLVGETCAALLATRTVRGSLGRQPLVDRRRLGRIGIACLAMVPALVAGWWLVPGRSALEVPGQLLGVGVAALFGGLAAACFLVALARPGDAAGWSPRRLVLGAIGRGRPD
jgi:putative peptidoglycan lipid II flippase